MAVCVGCDFFIVIDLYASAVTLKKIKNRRLDYMLL